VQCVVMLRVGVTIKHIKTEHLQNLLVLPSLNHMYINKNMIKSLCAQQNLGGHCHWMPPIATSVCTKCPVKTQWGCSHWFQSFQLRSERNVKTAQSTKNENVEAIQPFRCCLYNQW